MLGTHVWVIITWTANQKARKTIASHFYSRRAYIFWRELQVLNCFGYHWAVEKTGANIFGNYTTVPVILIGTTPGKASKMVDLKNPAMALAVSYNASRTTRDPGDSGSSAYWPGNITHNAWQGIQPERVWIQPRYNRVRPVVQLRS